MNKFNEIYNKTLSEINEVFTNVGTGTPTAMSPAATTQVKPKTPQEQQKAIADAAKILGVDAKKLAQAKAANLLDMDPAALQKVLAAAKIAGTGYQA